MKESPRPLINPLLEVSKFDSDSAEPMMLCVVPSEGESVRFAVPASYVELLREFNGERTTDEAVDAFLERNPDVFTKGWLKRLIDCSLIPKGLLVEGHQDPARVAVSRQPRRAFLHIKIPLIKPSVVDPIAHRLGFLFRREWMTVGLLVFVATHAYVYGVLIREHAVDFNQLNALSIIALLWLSTVSMIFHEFGHASAAARFGCRNTTIGWGLYFIYKVLWTDVSEAWKLPRWQRAIVDIGGVYFQSFFLLLMLAAYLYTGNTIYLFAFVFSDMQLGSNFNPFLRMDGYWLMSDLFGIVNLRQQQAIWVKSLAAKMFGHDGASVRSNLTGKARLALGIYTLLGAGFVVYLFLTIFVVVVWTVLKEYPGVVLGYWREWQAGMSGLKFLNAWLEIGWRTMMLIGAGMTAWSLTKKTVGLLGRMRIARASTQQVGI